METRITTHQHFENELLEIEMPGLVLIFQIDPEHGVVLHEAVTYNDEGAGRYTPEEIVEMARD